MTPCSGTALTSGGQLIDEPAGKEPLCLLVETVPLGVFLMPGHALIYGICALNEAV